MIDELRIHRVSDLLDAAQMLVGRATKVISEVPGMSERQKDLSGLGDQITIVQDRFTFAIGQMHAQAARKAEEGGRMAEP